MLEDKLNALKGLVVKEASLAKEMVKKSVDGLLRKDKGLLLEVIEKDEPAMNKLDIEVEEECVYTVALYQPKAKHLRTVFTVLKMNKDLERIGDLAVNIAQSALFLIERPQVKPFIDVPRMASEVLGMLSDAIDSFVNEDAKLAKSVCERDDLIDALRDQILRELITYMASEPSVIERAMHIIRVARCLERIGDLTTNIAEDVVFMVEGRVIKHGKSCYSKPQGWQN